MPKEIAHWLLARTAAEALRDSGLPDALVRAPADYPAHFYCGAVTPDSAFYSLFGPEKGRIRLASGATHLPDSPRRFIASPLLRALRRESGDGGFDRSIDAFRLGVVSHYAADEAFHPEVEAAAPTEQEHFRLEAHLDLCFLSMESAPFLPLNVRTLHARAARAPEACPAGTLYNGYLNSFLPEPDISRAASDRVLALHAFVQALFFSRPARALVSIAAAAAPASLASYPCLFYTDEPRRYQLFDRLPELEAEAAGRFLRYAGLMADGQRTPD